MQVLSFFASLLFVFEAVEVDVILQGTGNTEHQMGDCGHELDPIRPVLQENNLGNKNSLTISVASWILDFD